MLVLKGEMGYPSALSAKGWGFFDVSFKGNSFEFQRDYGCYVMENILFKLSYPAEFHAQTAVEAAVAGSGGVMVALRRVSSDPYGSETFLTPLAAVANVERLVPDGWIAACGSDVTPEFIEYVRPLASPIEDRRRFGAI